MEQALDDQEKLTDQSLNEQQDTTLNNESENATEMATIDSIEVQKAQNGELAFLFSWYGVVMFLILGFFVYYFTRLIGFSREVIGVTDYIAVIIQSFGMFIAILLLLTEYSYLTYSLIFMFILGFGCPLGMIYFFRLFLTKHTAFDGFINVFLFAFQILDLLIGMLFIYIFFYILFQRKPTMESIKAALQKITAKRVFTFLLAVLGAITVIVPFIQFFISIIVGKQ